MSETENLTTLSQRIDDLESQVAFQEQTIFELNQLVTRQNGELSTFKHHLQLLASRVSQVRDQQSESTSLIDDKPPHY